MPAPLHRCLAVWLVATALAVALVGALLPIALAPAARFDDALVRLCAAVATLTTTWLWGVTTAVALEARRGRSRVPVPAPLRRLVLAGCGVALVAGMATPAMAEPLQRQPQHASAVVEGTLASLPLP
ncbi:MAG: hypothetical protein WBP61_16220, partial [Nocardioides sp.]